MRHYWRDLNFSLKKNEKTGNYTLRGTVSFSDTIHIPRGEATPEHIRELENQMADMFFEDLINHPYFDKGRRDVYMRGYNDSVNGFGSPHIKEDDSLI